MYLRKFFDDFDVDYQRGVSIDGNVVSLELPGVKKSSIVLEMKPYRLSIKWTARCGAEMTRICALDATVNDAEAVFEDGLLTISLKTDKEKIKTIAVK